MTEDKVLEILERVGAFRSGHFVFTSWRHSDTYINKDALYPYTKETSELCREFAERFKDSGVEAVIGPAIAAAILAQWTAHHLSEMSGKTVYSAYADKDGEGGFLIKRGYDQVIRGKKVLIVEDLTTTGGSIKKVVLAVRAAGGEVVGTAVLCNRGNVKAADVGDVPRLESLVSLDLESWDPSECELCQAAIPVNTDVGHGREFIANKK